MKLHKPNADLRVPDGAVDQASAPSGGASAAWAHREPMGTPKC